MCAHHQLTNRQTRRRIAPGRDQAGQRIEHETALVHYPYLTPLATPRIQHYDFAASYALQTEFANNFFLHFAYDSTFVRYLPQNLLEASV